MATPQRDCFKITDDERAVLLRRTPAYKSARKVREALIRSLDLRSLDASARDNGMKFCRRCLFPKPFADFYAHPTTRDHLQSWCKGCLGRPRGL